MDLKNENDSQEEDSVLLSLQLSESENEQSPFKINILEKNEPVKSAEIVSEKSEVEKNDNFIKVTDKVSFKITESENLQTMTGKEDSQKKAENEESQKITNSESSQKLTDNEDSPEKSSENENQSSQAKKGSFNLDNSSNDSSSKYSTSQVENKSKNSLPTSSDSENDEIFEKRTEVKKHKQFASDSDSDVSESKDKEEKVESEKNSPIVLKNLTRLKGLIDLDSSEEEKDDKSEERKSPKEAARRNLFTSSDEDDIFDTKKAKKKKKKSDKSTKISDLIDSESDDDRPKKDNESEQNSTALSGDELKKKKKPKADRKLLSRKSKDNAKLEIKSETQRLLREEYVSLPYHRPKQRTLEEFLNRKKTVVPSAPTIAAKLAMYSDIVSKVAEEKEKEAEVFFDSEDSSEENSDDDIKSEKDKEEELNRNVENLVSQISSADPVENKEMSELQENSISQITSKDETENKMEIENQDKTETQNETQNQIETGNKDVPNVEEKDLVTAEIPQTENEDLTEEMDIDFTLDDMKETDDEIIQANKEVDAELNEYLESIQTENPENFKPKDFHVVDPCEFEKVKGNLDDDSQLIHLQLDSIENSLAKEKSPIPDSEKKSSQLSIREQLRHSVGDFRPKMSGDAEMVIDFSSGTGTLRKKGVDNLMERFMKHNVSYKRKKPAEEKKVDDDVIILEDESDNPKLKKPGVKMRMFKELLKQQIVTERYNEWKKKEEEEKELDKKVKDIEDNDEDKNEIEAILDLDEEEDLEDEEESEPEDDGYLFKEKKRKTCIFADDEAQEASDEEGVEEKEEEDEEEEDEESEEDEKEEEEPRKLSRIVRAFEDDSEEDEDSDLPKQVEEETNSKSNFERRNTSTDMFSNHSLINENSSEKDDFECQQPRPTPDESSQSKDEVKSTDNADKKSSEFENDFTSFDDLIVSPKKKEPSKKVDLKSWLNKQTKLFDNSSNNSAVNEEELIGICSGRFAESQMSKASQPESSGSLGLSSQKGSSKLANSTESSSLIGLIDQTQKQGTEESQLMAICSGTFMTQDGEKKGDDSQSANDKLEDNLMGNLSEDEEEEDFTKKSKKKLTKVKPLALSDDDENNSDLLSDEESEIEEDEVEEQLIEYDSEENEVIVVPMKNMKKYAKSKFLDNEAELSGSEADSEDEEEKGPDGYEADEADQEDIDQDRVRDELGKIHIKKLLDEDQRNVRFLQEIYFDDGDLHSDGGGRQRQFRWRNLDKIEDSLVNRGLDENEMDMEDEEGEASQIKERYEQNKFFEKLMQEKNENNELEDEFKDSQVFQVGLKVTKKSIKSVTEETTETVETVIKKPSHTQESSLMPSMLSSVLGIATKKVLTTPKLVKGSFLARGRDELNRIASKLNPDKELVLTKSIVTFQQISPSVYKKQKNRNVNEEEEKDSNMQKGKRKSVSESTPEVVKKRKTHEGTSSKRLF